ncbi:MAG TPA: FAD-binding oxidoreductase [Anaerolineaceae bacterium]|jgi:FAD/FMN-containing dehydrogenase
MTLPGAPAVLSNWSKSAVSRCIVYPAASTADIARALAAARAQGLSAIPHGAGHSYTDAALNTGGVVIDTTPMRRILAWDAASGVMRVQPGVTLREVVQAAWKDGWWPAVSPSTPDVTIGGCVAMNVNGRNAWKCGPFGAQVLSLEALLASGESCTLAPEREPQLFQAFVGGLGLLGILTSVTLQLQRLSSGDVRVRRRPAGSLAEIFALFAEEEPHSDFLEAWLDGFATGRHLGRGILTGAALSQTDSLGPSPDPAPGLPGRLENGLVRLGAGLLRPLLLPGVQTANRAYAGWVRLSPAQIGRQRGLYPFTFWPAAAFAGYHALFPHGVETFHAFVPGPPAQEVFERGLRTSQAQGCLPLWCVIKQHRRDPFLLSYQVDGFSLELNYQRTPQTAQRLQRVIESMITMVIEAGGRFYLAKDHFLTHAQYRQSIGDAPVDAFLRLKAQLDPETLLQSDLYRRVFQPAQPG